MQSDDAQASEFDGRADLNLQPETEYAVLWAWQYFSHLRKVGGKRQAILVER